MLPSRRPRRERPQPPAIPRDFPIYPGANFRSGSHSGKNASAGWSVSASTGSIKDYYEKTLQSGDWQLYGNQYTDPCITIWRFERRSDSHYGGYVSVYSPPGGATGLFISASVGPK